MFQIKKITVLLLLLTVFTINLTNAASAAQFTGSLTIIKEATPADGTDFEFTSTVLNLAPPMSFSLMMGSGVNGGNGPETCTVAADCQAGVNSGTKGGEFYFTSNVAVDSNGNLYVADAGHNRLQKFTSSGSFEWMIGSGVNGGSGPEICTVAANCQAGGFIGTQGSEFFGPIGVAVDGGGNVYVAEAEHHRVQKFNSSGSFEWMIGSGVNGGSGPEICTIASNCQAGGSGPQGGEFGLLHNVAVDSSGNLYVADAPKHRVQKFTSSGSFEWMIGSGVNGGSGPEICTVAANCQAGDFIGTQGGEFFGPIGVAVDGSGNVYVADTLKHRLQKFNSSGSFEWMIGSGVNGGSGPEICTVAADCQAGGSSGTQGGEFFSPGSLAVDSNGNLYVTEIDHNRIQKFNSSGSFEWMIGSGVNGGSGPEICTIAADCQAGSSSGTQGGEFFNPRGVAVDSSGNLYVADTGHDRVQKFVQNDTLNTFTLDKAVPDDNDGINQIITFNDLVPGNYDITEILPDGWQLNSINCLGNHEAETVAGETLTVAIGAGENIVCIFTSEQVDEDENNHKIYLPFVVK